MLDFTSLISETSADELARGYTKVFGRREPDLAPTLHSIAQLAVEHISGSDALYHDARHTMLVTFVGQAILRGRLLAGPLSAHDWLHFTIATLLHDIGYLRGACPGDREGRYVIDEGGGTVEAPRGASDAYLTPWHVDRGKIFVRHRCALIDGVDPERICRAIELTRFPVPEDGDHAETDTEAGLVRAADLIGQLGDPEYPRKLGALFHELRETGAADRLGYADAGDLAAQYPRFFWGKVAPYVGPALEHLRKTVEGRSWIAHLYAHVFVEEHQQQRSGPERHR